MNIDGWNDAFLADIRQRGRPGERLYLYVDRDLLARLSELSAGEAVTDFSKAFQADAGHQPFMRAADAARRWKARGFSGDPAFVAHLAMTVLAVTEEPSGNPNGIYRRQNELLGRPPEAVAPPGYGDHVPTLWRVWNSWLDGPGSCWGRSSARTHPHWTLQGWARSQGLIRYNDRLRIERFIEDLDGGDSTPSVSMLRQWLQYRGASARDLLAKLEDEAAQAVAEDVLDEEVARWRREGPRAPRQGRIRGLLHYDDWTGAFSGAVEVDPAWCGPVSLSQDQMYTPDPFDEFLLLTPTASAAHLLRDGVDHRLTDQAVVRIGGDDIYVMRDEPRVNGRLQCTALDAATNYHVLAHRSRLPELTQTLQAVGVDVSGRPSTVDGWQWLENIRLDLDSTQLRILGLAALIPTALERPKLEGGLQLAQGTYLVGGEPDVGLPANLAMTRLDGAPLAVPFGQRRIHLAEHILDPGVHTITSDRGQVTFRTITLAKETASSGGVGQPVRFTGDGFRFEDPTRNPDAPTVLAGAAFLGLDTPEPLVLRRPSAAECLVLNEVGEVHEIWPSTPQWLRRLGIEPSAVDVMDAVRTSASPAAFVVVRVGAHRRGVAIPAARPRIPGSTPSHPRPDLVAELVAKRWEWVGEPDDARAARVLTLAMQRRRINRPASSSQRRTRPTNPTMRHDVREGPLADNPFDDALTWLSEQEDGRVSATRFAQTWAWLCGRHNRANMAGEWRRALSTLAALGHVERDFTRQQVAAAPATLVALPSAAGLSVLCGARPARLVERMDDPDDADPLVAAAAGSWALHQRTPTALGGAPVGPCAVYVEWDRSERETVTTGLARLGVSVGGCTTTQLLHMHPTLQQAVRAGQQLSMSPSREPWVRRRTAAGAWEWVRSQTDSGRGFYRYRLASRDVFAWRDAPTAALVEVDPSVGQWLCQAMYGQTSLLVYQPVARMLLAPAAVPLPRLIVRALVLRTGLPAYRAHLQSREQAYLVYENVDATAADHVARKLQQVLQIDNTPLRMDR